MTTTTTHLDVTRRHDFILLFDVTDGNPNGDPDAGNLPRTDPETMQGIVTDVALKRKVRDYVDVTRGTEAAYKIYVQQRAILANQQRRAFQALNKGPVDRPDDEARAWMCQNFYDVRMFGAVMTVGKAGKGEKGGNLQWNCGQVRGPIQLTFARSINEVTPLDISITRVALTNADDTGKQTATVADGVDEKAASGQMGRKSLIPYGLYRAHGFFNPHLAKDTGVSDQDLEIFWQALRQMWDFDRSASRGMMACQGLFIFTHESDLGNAPAYDLFKRVRVEKLPGVEAPRSVMDYSIEVFEDALPEAITLTRF
jgi:CRISPR-associated protein Csd2